MTDDSIRVLRVRRLKIEDRKRLDIIGVQLRKLFCIKQERHV
nr:MAG TPA: hypothetical protein [Caudoviricetes sp.]